MPHASGARALLETRRAVRIALRGESHARVLVACSGGADSLSLAAALAHEARSLDIETAALVVDHGLQENSAAVAATAARQLRLLGFARVLERRVTVPEDGAGPESAARIARYEAFRQAALETEATLVFTGHTRDDQAEQVLLALARGSGTRSLAGIPPRRELAAGVMLVRPYLTEDPAITRDTTARTCRELGLDPWQDPHNHDPRFARVRARDQALPALDAALGPGVPAALARSADLAREDAEALDQWASTVLASVRIPSDPARGMSVAVEVLTSLPDAIVQRVIRELARVCGAGSLSRLHTREIVSLVTAWRGQGPAFVPGLRVERREGDLTFEPQLGSPRDVAPG